MTPLEYFNVSSDSEGWSLQLPSQIHGAFGGVTGGALAAASVALSRTVDAALPKDRWVPHPNPDLSLRFMEEVTSNDLIAIGTCREMSRGFAIVQTEVWQDQSLVATGVSTSLLTANS